MRQILARGVLASLAGMLVLVLWGLVFWSLLADPLGVFHYLVVAALAVTLVFVSGRMSYIRRFSLVLLGGLIGSIFITAGDPIWFHLPWDYSGAVLLYEVISWVLLGSVVAKLAPPLRTA